MTNTAQIRYLRLSVMTIASVVIVAGLSRFVMLTKNGLDPPPHDSILSDNASRLLLPTTSLMHLPVSRIAIADYSERLPSRLELNRLVPLSSSDSFSVSALLHIGRYYGMNSCIAGGGLALPTPIIDILTDERVAKTYYHGGSPFVRTRYGCRIRMVRSPSDQSPMRESHQDQVLASFAEWGVPLTHSIKFENETLSVKELLSDSMASFSIEQEELHWTLVSYLMYNPLQNTWENKFGQEFSLDGVVRELLLRAPSSSSCGGLHQVYALCLADQINSQFHFLSTSTSMQLEQWLHMVLKLVEASQLTDGSWGSSWHMGRFDSKISSRSSFRIDVNSIDDKQLIVSHMGEVFALAGTRFRINKPMLQRMATWMSAEATKIATTPARTVKCPYVHIASLLNRSR
jgi:hypothetical protein